MGDERRRRRSPRRLATAGLSLRLFRFPLSTSTDKTTPPAPQYYFCPCFDPARALAAGNCPLNAQTHIPESQLSFICFEGIVERQPGAITGAQLLLSLPERSAQCSLRALRFCFRALFCCFAEHASPRTAAAAGLTAIKSCQLVITLQWQFHHPH